MSSLPRLGARGEGWVVIQFVLLAAVALSGLMWVPVTEGRAASVAALLGLALMAVGAVLVGRGLWDLGRNLTPVPHPRSGAELVQHGLYRLVRHPIYGGLVITAFGWALVSLRPLTLLLAIVTLAFFDLKSRREEAWLVEHYPDYAAYREGTRRLIPWLY